MVQLADIKHLLYKKFKFSKQRKEIHQKHILQDLFSTATPAEPNGKPKAIIVIGGAGSGKSKIRAEIKKKGDMDNSLYIDSDVIKSKLVSLEKQRTNLSEEELHSALQGESVILREEALYRATKKNYNLVLETVGSNPHVVASNIKRLRSKGYDVEIHLVNTDCEIALERTKNRNQKIKRKVHLSYVKSSNRKAKKTYKFLLKEFRGKIKHHIWNNNGTRPILDDQNMINVWYEVCININARRREKICQDIDIEKNKLITDHLKKINDLNSQDINKRDPNAMLFTIMTDIALFPEIYINKNMDKFLQYIDKSDMEVFWGAQDDEIPFVKTRSCIAIGSPSIGEIITLSAGKDKYKSKIKLPDDFRKKLIKFINSIENLDDTIINEIGDKQEIIKLLKSNQDDFDTSVLYKIVHLSPELEKEFKEKIVKKVKDHELWTKPRSNQQQRETYLFKKEYRSELKNTLFNLENKTAYKFINFFRFRKISLTSQKMSCSKVVKRWLSIEANKQKLDKSRTLNYQNREKRWLYKFWPSGKSHGNTNTIAGYMLGRKPKHTGFFQIGSDKAKFLNMPKKKTFKSISLKKLNEIRIDRESRAKNRKDMILFEAHLAKLIVENPKPYVATVLKVNNYISNYLENISSHKKKSLSKVVGGYFSEYDGSDSIKFLQNKLKSEKPEDVFRALLFHKFFFEKIAKPPSKKSKKVKRIYSVLRKEKYFGSRNRGRKKSKKFQVKTNSNHIGMLDDDILKDSCINKNSYNTLHNQKYGASRFAFTDLNNRNTDIEEIKEHQLHYYGTYKDQVKKHDPLFFAGSSGSVTQVIPHVYGYILDDDPIAQDEYLMAMAASMSYAGHHSFYEAYLPVFSLKDNCPERFQNMTFDNNFYKIIPTRKFMNYVKNTLSSDKKNSIFDNYKKKLEKDYLALRDTPLLKKFMQKHFKRK